MTIVTERAEIEARAARDRRIQALRLGHGRGCTRIRVAGNGATQTSAPAARQEIANDLGDARQRPERVDPGVEASPQRARRATARSGDGEARRAKAHGGQDRPETRTTTRRWCEKRHGRRPIVRGEADRMGFFTDEHVHRRKA